MIRASILSLTVILALPTAAEAKVAALTFADGPHGQYTDPVLDILDNRNAVATFFVIGVHAEQRPGLVVREDKKHEVGNHSWSHPHLPELSNSEVREELDSVNDLLKDRLGTRPDASRPPYSDTNRRVEGIANDLSMTETLWNIDSGDWKTPQPSCSHIRENVRSKLGRERAVISLHDASPLSRNNTICALPGIITDLRNRNYSLTTVSGLLAKGWNGDLG